MKRLKTYSRYTSITILLSLLCFYAYADEQVIQVSAHASINAKPDVLIADLYISETNKSVSAAKKIVDIKSKKVIERLKNLGLKDADISSYQIEVYPKSERDRQTGDYVQVGFTVSRKFHIIVRDFADIDAVLDSAVKLGVNRIGRVDAQISDSETLYLKALEQALRNAQEKANRLAKVADKKVTEVLSIQESAGQPIHRVRESAMLMSDTVSEPGSKEVTAQITVIYKLE
ncbi:SIMPL domain-containing protein [Catenovulum sp. SM1970]|uniref:SIMPL domain-containing protein n=1 Tax=Marinifaba aquimaris TaxID=2741323 RepID=UPI001572DC49|nr:SIMPL domain-containing protein [Marinifaba aquimaris]NTS76985.1 SIMPL domain-containing protein [Marinifaba aquimaris]